MRKSNYIRHLTLYLFILVVFSGSFLYPFSSDIDLAAGPSFSFDVNTPVNNTNLNDKIVQISGTYSLDTVTYPDSSLTVSIKDNTDPANPVDIPTTGLIINLDDTWSFSKEFTQGPHTVTFTANDGFNVPISKDISFTIDTQRPVVANYKLISPTHVGNSNVWDDSIIEDMTHVPLDAKIQITVNEGNSLTYKKESDGTTYTNPIKITSENQTNVVSVEDHQSPPQPDTNGDYIITFTPSTQLDPSTTYFVYLTTNILDSSGNPVYPKVIKFTTTSQKEQSDDDDPHGDYGINDPDTGINRTNLCANCHSTHTGGSVKLLGGKFIKDPSKNPNEPDNTTNYCMACHDGTSATRMATKVGNMDLSTGSKHDEVLDTKHLANEGSCSSCHNPHLVWSKDNPNILKDHFVYDHKLVDPSKNAPQEILDSDEILCETCHDRKTVLLKDYAGVEYKISHYRKSTTRLGTIEDNDLCLRCHNANKLPNSDIKTMYENSNSKHNFTALDGSNVTGALPCTECHETHGSSNIKLLKQNLGQENLQGEFTAATGEWDITKERDFCLRCHNGSTAIYGVTGKALSPTNHTNTEGKSCSECHSDGYDPNDPLSIPKAFMEAAHGPKKGEIK